MTDPNNFASNLTPGMPETSQARSLTRDANSNFVVPGGTTTMNFERTDSNAANSLAAARTYRITIGSDVYDLTYDTSTNEPSYSGSASNGNTMQLFLNENQKYASILNPQVTIGSGASASSEQYFGIIGQATPAGSLSGTAKYSGSGEISIDNKSGQFDDAENTTVSFDVNFGSSQITNGVFVVTDTSNDSNGGNVIDIDVTTGSSSALSLPFTGSVTQNSFTANLNLNPLAAVTTGVSSLSSTTIKGGFFGPNAENASGVGLSTGQSPGASGTDIVVYTRIQSSKQ